MLWDCITQFSSDATFVDPSSRSIQSSLKLTRDKKKNPRVSDIRVESEQEENETLWKALCRDEYNMVRDGRITNTFKNRSFFDHLQYKNWNVIQHLVLVTNSYEALENMVLLVDFVPN